MGECGEGLAATSSNRTIWGERLDPEGEGVGSPVWRAERAIRPAKVSSLRGNWNVISDFCSLEPALRA